MLLILKNKDFQFLYTELADKKKSRYEFLKSPDAFLKTHNYKLSDSEKSWLIFRFGEKLINNSYNIQYDFIAKEACSSILNDICST